MLRGINVSGHKKIKMADLRDYLSEIGFGDVKTYIQSGNIIFSYKESDPNTIAEMIASQIKSKYDFDVPTLVKTTEDFEYVVTHNPFTDKKDMAIEKIYVTFLADTPDSENISKLNDLDFNNEEFVLDGRYVYLYFDNGFGKAKLNNNFLENKLKVRATTRNWKTVSKLLEMTTGQG